MTAGGAGAPPAPNRIDLITASLELAGLGLEIGPSHNPILPKRDGYNVRVVDHLETSRLIAKYQQLGVDTAKVEDVDYVVEGERLSDVIDASFDYIVASHVMEHTPCLISFLQDCSSLLEPGGSLSLALPDKRYCFDHFRERSSLGRVIDTYEREVLIHSPGSVADFAMNAVNRDQQITWSRGCDVPFSRIHDLDGVRAMMAVAGAGTYVDIHNWVLTPYHTRLLLDDLYHLGYIDLRERSFHDTVGFEFFLTLSKAGPGPDLSRAELSERAYAELAAG